MAKWIGSLARYLVLTALSLLLFRYAWRRVPDLCGIAGLSRGTLKTILVLREKALLLAESGVLAVCVSFLLFSFVGLLRLFGFDRPEEKLSAEDEKKTNAPGGRIPLLLDRGLIAASFGVASIALFWIHIARSTDPPPPAGPTPSSTPTESPTPTPTVTRTPTASPTATPTTAPLPPIVNVQVTNDIVLPTPVVTPTASPTPIPAPIFRTPNTPSRGLPR